MAIFSGLFLFRFMKLSILPFLFLSLPVVAQYRPMYSPSRPSYTPSRPITSPTSNYNYQSQLRTQQQAHQNFQQMQAQQRQQMMDHYYYYSQRRSLTQQQHLLRHPLSPEQLAQQQAHQQEAEQKANEQLARLAETQRQHQANPPADAQQAAAQQKEDAQQLTQLTLKHYREVFLPGQLSGALQSLTLAPQARQELQTISHDLLDTAWWSQQDATQLPAKVAAHSATLTKLTTDLLGFSPAAVPVAPASRPASALREQLSQGATFDQAAAARLIREAAQAEKRLAGEQLARAVTSFNEVSSKVAASPATTAKAQKQQRNEVKNSLQRVNKELQRYNARVGTTGPLLQTQAAITEATAEYLAKNKN